MRNKFLASIYLNLVLLFVLFGMAMPASAVKLEDGVYLRVNKPNVSDLPSFFKFENAINENCWLPNAGLFEQFVYLESGSSGFSIVSIINGGEEVVFGPAASFRLVDVRLYTEPSPQSDFRRGEFEISTSPFTVTQSGLFQVALDTSTKWITMLPIKTWNIVGTATPYGWKPIAPIQLKPLFAPDHASCIFVADSVKLTKGWYKFRYSDGWKITVDTLNQNDCWNKGSKVNTNFGGDLNQLLLGGGNIQSDFHGIYKVSLLWNQGKSITASVEKIGDIPEVDYSNYAVGIVGDAYMDVNGKREKWVDNWNVASETKLPVKNGDVYTWTYTNVPLLDGGEFKFRQGNTWRGLAIESGDIGSWSGNAKDDFSNMDKAFHVVNKDGKPYTIILQIDGKTGNSSLEVSK